MRPFLAGLALALLIVSPVAAAAGASITATDTTFPGQSFITYVEPNRYDGSLWARVDCIALDGPAAGSVGLAQYEKLDGIDDWFTIDQTPSWSGGAATCNVRMLVLNGYRRDRLVAETTFAVN